VYSCYRYDSICRDRLLVRESESCHVLNWPTKHACMGCSKSVLKSICPCPFSHFRISTAASVCTLRNYSICKVSDMSFATTAANMLDDTLAIRKRLCCLLRVCVKTVVSILFWWFNKGILLLVSTNNHVAWLWDNCTICSGTAVQFACLGC